MKREWEKRAMLLGLFNQSRVFSTTGQAEERLCFNNNFPHCSFEDGKSKKVTRREDSPINHLHQPADAWSSITVGQMRATEVWEQM